MKVVDQILAGKDFLNMELSLLLWVLLTADLVTTLTLYKEDYICKFQ